MPVVNADLNWAIEDVRSRQESLALFKAYDEGNHRLLFATEKYRNTFGDLFQEFADNLCDDVVDAITDRLQITSWTSNDKGLATTMAELWEANQGEARTGAVHRNGFRDGDGFVIVQTNTAQQARMYKQDPRTMAVRYSTESPDEIELAAKVWKAGTRYRVNLYYPDRTEKYASKGMGAAGGLPRAAAFTLLAAGDPALKGDEEGVNEHGEGVPAYHYPNGELSQYGRSILVGVIPIQDALNKSIADMLVTMEAHAAPLRWASGVQVEIDPVTGEERDPFRRANEPGSILRTGAKDARFGQFSAAELTGFLEVQDSFKMEAARKGAMPPWSITTRGSNGSAAAPGISMLVAEGRTIKLAKDRHRDWGGEHRRMMAHLLRLQLGTEGITAKDVDLDWAPPETRDETAKWELLRIKNELGVPTSQILAEGGYDPTEVAKFLDELEAELEDTQAAMAAAAGGRQRTTRGQARTLNETLGQQGTQPAPVGGQSAMVGA